MAAAKLTAISVTSSLKSGENKLGFVEGESLMFGNNLELWLIVMALNWTLLRLNLVIKYLPI